MDRLTRYARSTRPARFSAQFAALAPMSSDPRQFAFQGKFPVRVEFKAGEFRDNRPGQWSRRMNADYGELSGIPGADGDAMDCYIGPNPEAPDVFVIHQVDRDGEFDEHKVMLGYDSEGEAVESYLSHYPPGWKMGPVKRMTVDEFAAWADGMRAFNGPSFEDTMRAAFLAPVEHAPPEPSSRLARYAAKRRTSEGQKDLFGGETSSRQPGLRWITIHPGEGKGRPVQIDGEGTIVAGALPRSMHGTKIGDLKKNMEAEKKGDATKKAPAKPKDEPKGKKEPKAGGVEWVRAPAGGATSDVNGQHYKGGQLMPIHGLSEKTENRPKGKGDGEPLEAPSEEGKERRKREPRQPLSPEMIEAERKDREEKAKWRRLKEGTLGKLAGLGDRPGHVFHSGGVKQWNEVAGGLSAEQVDQIAEFARNMVLSHEQKPDAWKPGYSSKPYPGDDAIAEMVDEDTDRFAQSNVEMFPRVFSKKKLAEVPRFAEAHVRLNEAIEKASFDQLHEIGAMLDAVAKGEAPPEETAPAEPTPAPEAHPHESMKDRVRESLADGGAKSLGELQEALHGERHDPRDPLAHPVNRALMELRDAGEIEVQEKAFGEPAFKAKGAEEAPTTEAPKQPWQMTSDEHQLSQQGFTYGDWFTTPDGRFGRMQGSGGMGSGRVRLYDVNGESLGWHSRDELTPVQKSKRYLDSHDAADKWLADVSSRVKKLQEDNAGLLLGKTLRDRFERSVREGGITPDRFAELRASGSVISDADYEKAKQVEQQIAEARETPLVAPVNEQHRAAVEQAMKDGHAVPARVLAEYPDLAPGAPESAPESAPSTEPAASPNAPGVDPNGIPLSLGVAAHNGTSHSPESRGAYEQREYVSMLNEDYANLSAMAKTPEQKAILAEEWQRYVDTHTAKRRDYLAARSRVMSPMIAGPSKFPTRRNEKRNQTADRRREEMIGHRDKSLKAIRSKLGAESGGPIKTADPKADDKIGQAIAERTAMQQKMKDANAVIRRTGVKIVPQGQGSYEVTYPKMPREEVVRQLLEAGVRDEATASKLLLPDYMGNVGYASYQLSNNNKEIKRLEGRAQEVAKLQSTEASETTHGDITVRENPELGRIQLEFPGKPDEATRSKLKSLGFRWAPSEGAWQRHLNEAGRHAARQFVASRPAPESPEQYSRRLGLDPGSRLARYAMRPQFYRQADPSGGTKVSAKSNGDGTRWITIGAKDSGNGRKGGIPVQIDGDGTIVGGKRAESLGLHKVHPSDLKEHFGERRAMQAEGKGGSDDFGFGAPSEAEHTRQREAAAQSLPGKRSQIRKDLIEAAGDDERDQAALYSLLKDVHREKVDQVRDYNEQIDGLYSHLTSKLGDRLSLIAQLRKRSDPSKVQGFDEVLDTAKRHFPALLHDPDGGGDEEYALAEALRNGRKATPTLDDAWGEAYSRWGGKGEYDQARDEELDAVPFSMRLARYAARSTPERIEKNLVRR